MIFDENSATTHANFDEYYDLHWCGLESSIARKLQAPLSSGPKLLVREAPQAPTIGFRPATPHALLEITHNPTPRSKLK